MEHLERKKNIWDLELGIFRLETKNMIHKKKNISIRPQQN